MLSMISVSILSLSMYRVRMDILLSIVSLFCLFTFNSAETNDCYVLESSGSFLGVDDCHDAQCDEDFVKCCTEINTCVAHPTERHSVTLAVTSSTSRVDRNCYAKDVSGDYVVSTNCFNRRCRKVLRKCQSVSKLCRDIKHNPRPTDFVPLRETTTIVTFNNTVCLSASLSSTCTPVEIDDGRLKIGVECVVASSGGRLSLGSCDLARAVFVFDYYEGYLKNVIFQKCLQDNLSLGSCNTASVVTFSSQNA